MTRHILNGDSATRKAAPIASGLLHYFPNACAYVANVSRLGNEKHSPGQPLHWAYDKSADHADCVGRHLARAGRSALDDDGNPATDGLGGELRESGLVAWRALALLESELVKAGAEPGINVRREPPTEPDAATHRIEPRPGSDSGTMTIGVRMDTSQIREEVSTWLAWLASAPPPVEDKKSPARVEAFHRDEEQLIRN